MAIPDFMRATLAPLDSQGEQVAPLPGLPPPAGEPPPAQAQKEPERRVVPFPMPGYYEDMPAQDYFDVEAMSQSGAKKILRSPEHYILDRKEQKEPTPNMILGTAIHAALLEPDRFPLLVIQGAENAPARPTKAQLNAAKPSPAALASIAYWKAFDEANKGKIVLDPETYARCIGARDAVRRKPRCMRLIEETSPEASLFWIDGEYQVRMKARLDLRAFGGIADLKSTGDASPDEFVRSCVKFGYHVQAANYFSGCEHVLDYTPAFFALIAVETDPPYGVGLYAMPTAAIQAGGVLMRVAMERYAEAIATGVWKGYDEAIVELKFPKWALRFDL